MLLLLSSVVAQTPKLSNPQRSVFVAFPAADSYQVIARTVNADARRRIESSLPFRVHFDELGSHSLYVAYRGRQPVGMIYVQREESAFGLAAVEWAFTTNLRVAGFQFQYVRSRYRQAIERSEFVRNLKGKGSRELAAMLDADGNLRRVAAGLDKNAQGLATTITRSGLKSLAVLETVWANDTKRLHDLAIGLRAFPTAKKVQRVWPSLRTSESDQKADVVALAVRALDSRNQAIGIALLLQTTIDKEQYVVRWIISRDGCLRDPIAPAKASRAFRAACASLTQKTLSVVAERTDSVGVAFRRALTILRTASAPPR